MDRSYKINEGLRYAFVLRLFISVALSVIITLLIYISLSSDVSLVIFIGTSLVVAFMTMWITKSFSRRKVEIIMKPDLLHIYYHKSLFLKESELKIKWSVIRSFRFQLTQNFTIFELELVNRQLRLFHDVSDLGKDDFEEFEHDFILRIKNENTTYTSTEAITQKPTIYETKLGRIAAVVIACILVIFPIVL